MGAIEIAIIPRIDGYTDHGGSNMSVWILLQICQRLHGGDILMSYTVRQMFKDQFIYKYVCVDIDR